jgi:UDPglucose 6-dehydrogenase
VVISDPKALDNARADLGGSERTAMFEIDPYRAVQGAHALAILTEWEEYKRLDFQRIFNAMEKPAFVFDGRNILDHHGLFEMGFNVYPIGKPGLSHFK